MPTSIPTNSTILISPPVSILSAILFFIIYMGILMFILAPIFMLMFFIAIDLYAWLSDRIINFTLLFHNRKKRN